jgi:uncharacterized protein (DUF849 family)
VSRPAIITCALTGDNDTPGKSPHFPATPTQLADDTEAAFRAGAAIVRTHARDPSRRRDATIPRSTPSSWDFFGRVASQA